MKKYFLPLLLLALPLTIAAQKPSPAKKPPINYIGEFRLDWSDGIIDLVAPPSGKLTATLTGSSRPISLVAQENGGEVLTKSGLKSRRRELSGQKIVAVAAGGKGKKTRVTDAHLTRNVTVLIEQLSLDDQKLTIKVRCDDALYKAGAKLGTGRIDFSGNAHIWYYGTLDIETTMQSGWIDLGDPDDAENKPPTLHLEKGNTIGTPGKGKG